MLTRLAWIFGGSLLVFCAIYIAMGKAPGLADAIFVAFALGLIAVRFVDIRYLHGETMDSKPATMKHWRRYSIVLLAVAAVLYLAAKTAARIHLL